MTEVPKLTELQLTPSQQELWTLYKEFVYQMKEFINKHFSHVSIKSARYFETMSIQCETTEKRRQIDIIEKVKASMRRLFIDDMDDFCPRGEQYGLMHKAGEKWTINTHYMENTDLREYRMVDGCVRTLIHKQGTESYNAAKQFYITGKTVWHEIPETRAPVPIFSIREMYYYLYGKMAAMDDAPIPKMGYVYFLFTLSKLIFRSVIDVNMMDLPPETRKKFNSTLEAFRPAYNHKGYPKPIDSLLSTRSIMDSISLVTKIIKPIVSDNLGPAAEHYIDRVSSMSTGANGDSLGRDINEVMESFSTMNETSIDSIINHGLDKSEFYTSKLSSIFNKIKTTDEEEADPMALE